VPSVGSIKITVISSWLVMAPLAKVVMLLKGLDSLQSGSRPWAGSCNTTQGRLVWV
jgi:hypothetical protein